MTISTWLFTKLEQSPLIANIRTAEKRVNAHFNAHFGIHQFGHVHKIRSNFMPALRWCTQFSVGADSRCGKENQAVSEFMHRRAKMKLSRYIWLKNFHYQLFAIVRLQTAVNINVHTQSYVILIIFNVILFYSFWTLFY